MVRKKLVLIQFSRALVPLFVMLFHTSLTMIVFFGFNFLGFSALPKSGGVNYFFALSGFMIYYVYRESLGQPSKLKEFLLNRFIRVYPLYWILTLVYFLFIYPWYGMGYETEIGHIITSFLLFPNPSELLPILIPAWSLVHTVFFYLVFSLLFFTKMTISKGIIAIWAILTLAHSFGALSFNHFLLRFVFDQVNLIFIAGILCAYLVTHFTFNFKVSIFLSVIGVLGFPLMWLNSLNPFINIDFDIGTGFASVLLILGIASIDMQKDINITKLFNYLGNAAFSIYLSHSVVLDFFAELFERTSIYEVIGGWMTSIIFLVLMLLGGCLVYSFIEKPLTLKLKQIVLKKKTDSNNISGVS